MQEGFNFQPWVCRDETALHSSLGEWKSNFSDKIFKQDEQSLKTPLPGSARRRGRVRSGRGKSGETRPKETPTSTNLGIFLATSLAGVTSTWISQSVQWMTTSHVLFSNFSLFSQILSVFVCRENTLFFFSFVLFYFVPLFVPCLPKYFLCLYAGRPLWRRNVVWSTGEKPNFDRFPWVCSFSSTKTKNRPECSPFWCQTHFALFVQLLQWFGILAIAYEIRLPWVGSIGK